MCNHEHNSLPEVAARNIVSIAGDVSSVIEARMLEVHTDNPNIDREVVVLAGILGGITSALQVRDLPRDEQAIKAYLHSVVDSFRMGATVPGNEERKHPGVFGFKMDTKREGLLFDGFTREAGFSQEQIDEADKIIANIAKDMGIERLPGKEGIDGYKLASKEQAQEFLQRIVQAGLAARNL